MILKQQPEDFIVNEILDLSYDEKGKYSYYQLTKKNLNTIEAIELVAKIFNVEIKYINFAGTKDKQAVTKQFISIAHGPAKDITQEIPQNNSFLHLSYLGRGIERLNIGSLTGNAFAITVREAEKEPTEIQWIVNYFDDQRFGAAQKNHLIGKLLLKQKFKEACELIGLVAEKNNYVQALQSMHKKKLQLFIHAYQGWLFNRTISEYVQQKYKTKTKVPTIKFINYNLGELAIVLNKIVLDKKIIELNVPIIGFGFDIESVQDTILKEIIEKIMYDEEITQRDFVIRSLQGMSSEGGERTLFANVQDLEIQKIDAKTYKITFNLQKGSYATIAVKSMF